MKPELCDPCADGEHGACFRKDWNFDSLAADSTQVVSRKCDCPVCNGEN